MISITIGRTRRMAAPFSNLCLSCKGKLFFYYIQPCGRRQSQMTRSPESCCLGARITGPCSTMNGWNSCMPQGFVLRSAHGTLNFPPAPFFSPCGRGRRVEVENPSLILSPLTARKNFEKRYLPAYRCTRRSPAWRAPMILRATGPISNSASGPVTNNPGAHCKSGPITG